MSSDTTEANPPTAKTPVIEIRGLVKVYDDFYAVAGLDLNVHRGELYAMLGRNGAGKTTTIKCLAGLLRPTSGSVSVAGRDLVKEAAEAKRALGYVPDRPFLYEKLTGAEFIGFMGELYGNDPEEVMERARRYIDLFELAGWEGELIETYSYGMRQKLVLSSVFARESEALLIDEPIVGLDPKATKTLRELLRELTDAGKAILMSTHSVQIAQIVSDRIGIIETGKLIAEGTLEELQQQAATPGSDLEDVFLSLTASESPSLSPIAP